jgi:uncharacterized protein YjiS (DUF1127 family)
MIARRTPNRPGLLALLWTRLRLWWGTRRERAAYRRLFDDGRRKPPR